MNKKMLTFIACAGLLSVLNAAPDEDSDEKNMIGGAGGLSVGMMWLDMDPLKEIAEDDLNRTGFEFENNRFMTIDLIGYGGNRRNGLRIGWKGTFGYNTVYSDPWKGKSTDSVYIQSHPDSLIDSVVQLHNLAAYGGLLVEKSFNIYENIHLYAGTMIGGGVLISIADERLGNDAFDRIDYSDNNEFCFDEDSSRVRCDSLSDNKVAVAPLWAFDVHGGTMYSLTNWMHIGFDASLTMFYSSTGFSYRQGSFNSVNPGLKIRLIFGNAV